MLVQRFDARPSCLQTPVDEMRMTWHGRVENDVRGSRKAIREVFSAKLCHSKVQGDLKRNGETMETHGEGRGGGNVSMEWNFFSVPESN